MAMGMLNYLRCCISDHVDEELMLMNFTSEDIAQAERQGLIVREEGEDEYGFPCTHRIVHERLRSFLRLRSEIIPEL